MNVPPEDIQRAFDHQIAPIHRQIETIKRNTGLLTRTRDALLPRLISGKLPVDTLDIRFPPSMQRD
jgi:type I restriction enzyme S subunit